MSKNEIEQLQAQVSALQATIDAAYEMLLTNPIQQKDTVTISKTLDILKPREPMLVDHRFWTDPANAPKPQAIASQPVPQAGLRYVPIRYELQEYEYRDDDGNLQPALGLYASDAGEFVTTFNIEDRERMQPEVDRMNAEAQAAADSLNAGEQGGGE